MVEDSDMKELVKSNNVIFGISLIWNAMIL